MLLLASTLATMAQQQFVVADVETMQPIAGVSIQGSGPVLTTDSTGHFLMTDSCHTLIVSHLNYESRIIDIRTVHTDTLFLISKLHSTDEVFVFGQRPYDDPRVSELNRRLRIDPKELQMQQAQPNGNLLGLIKYLIPKKWRKGGHKRQRAQHHDEVLREY